MSDVEIKCLIQKNTIDGEMVAFEVKDSLENIKSCLPEIYSICDSRLRDMNMRIIVANELLNNFTWEEKIKFNYLVDVMHGQVSAEVAKNRLNIDAEDKELAKSEDTAC